MDYRHITLEDKDRYASIRSCSGERGCEYGFANLFLWGRQRMAYDDRNVSVFSQFDRRSVYLFPVGCGDIKATVDKIIHDAKIRDIPCRITGLTEADCRFLEENYPGRFRFHTDRNSFDYLYSIDHLADLPGRKYQRKRNHINRFMQQYPHSRTEPITEDNVQKAREMAACWYAQRQQQDPTADFQMEQAALYKALEHFGALDMEGLILWIGDQVAAMTLGSFLTEQTFDVQFEKALECFDGAYTVINNAFARHLRKKYPGLQWLNREEDMGIEGLRKAKLSYHPVCLREKYWARLLEEGYDY